MNILKSRNRKPSSVEIYDILNGYYHYTITFYDTTSKINYLTTSLFTNSVYKFKI